MKRLRGTNEHHRPTDLPALVAATLVLAAGGVLASWLPARRAARVDRMVALRSE